MGRKLTGIDQSKYENNLLILLNWNLEKSKIINISVLFQDLFDEANGSVAAFSACQLC